MDRNIEQYKCLLDGKYNEKRTLLLQYTQYVISGHKLAEVIGFMTVVAVYFA